MAQVGITEDQGEVKVTSIFKIKVQELKNLFNKEIKFEDRLDQIQENHGGMDCLLEKLQTQRGSGIMGDDRDLKRRLANFGHNTKPAPHLNSFWTSLKEAFEDKILLVVAVCAVLSIIFGMIYDPKTGWVEGVSIFVVLAVMVLITSLNDFIKDRQFVKLQSQNKDSKLAVKRGKKGQMQTVDMWDLVVGDVVTLNAGDIVPADCIIVRSESCEVIEPNTEKGEGTRHPRSEENPFLFSDEQLINGSCNVVVACVGKNSTRPMEEAQLNTDETELQQKLWPLTKTFTFIGIIASFIILVTAIIIQSIQTGVNEEVGGKIFMQKLFQNITLFIVLIMVAIPEGLPMTVSISLAHSTTRLYTSEAILVRKLDAPERMGQITEICTGLTGTLTTGDMTVQNFYAQQKNIVNNRKDTLKHCELTEGMVTLIKESIMWNNECHMELNQESFYIPVGNDTERAYLRWLQDAEINVHDHNQHRMKNEVHRMPFNSITKRSVVAVRHPEMEDTIRIYVKGASEVILPKCDYEFDEEGNKVPLDDDRKREMKKFYTENYNKLGFRTLGFSYRDLSEREFHTIINSKNENEVNWKGEDLLVNNQTFVTLIAMKDPLRDQVKKAIRRAERAGVNVRIVTNNNLDTAITQAIDSNILPLNFRQLEPAEQRNQAMLAEHLVDACGGLKEEQNADGQVIFTPVDQNAFEQAVENLKVLARASPDDKLLLTAGLMAAGKKTAVIGDGNNDIKSFGSAHVSFCMGSGTVIAKQESDIVLTDDDFFDCMNAVMWGRNIYTNIKRFLMFQITCNFSVLITVFIGYLYLTESPFTSTQLLWVNLIMDTFAALSLATMPPMLSVLDEPAIKDGHKILQKTVWRQIYGITLWNVIIMSIMIFGGKAIFNLKYENSTQTTEREDGQLTAGALAKKEHLTICFNTFIQLIWFNMFNCRVVGPKEMNITKNFFSSWIFIFIMIGIAVMQWSSCNWLSWLFETINLSYQVYFRCVAWGFTVIPVAILIKLTPESWVDRIPVAIDEDTALGKGNIIMKGYEGANAQRKTAGASEVQQAEDDAISKTSQVEGQVDEKDDDFKQV